MVRAAADEAYVAWYAARSRKQLKWALGVLSATTVLFAAIERHPLQFIISPVVVTLTAFAWLASAESYARWWERASIVTALTFLALILYKSVVDYHSTGGFDVNAAIVTLVPVLAGQAGLRIRATSIVALCTVIGGAIAVGRMETLWPEKWLEFTLLFALSGLVACATSYQTHRLLAGEFEAARSLEREQERTAADRVRTESLLKQEVSHQVAARSRELGLMLARIEAPLAPRRPSVGDRFDTRYQVIAELGAGGMGAVFEVERLTDGQRLALKIVTGDISGKSAARFAREAEIGAALKHENLVAIVDVGVAQGVPFLAMELARGGSLEDQRERFGDVPWAVSVLCEIANGLAALHEAGVVHRDLKPANVLFTGEGEERRAKISDFGISRFGLLDSAHDVDPNASTLAAPAKHVGLTATGMLLGTPLYMAPEAADGGKLVGAPADVFAFGILAAELLAGRAPFATPPVYLALSGQALPEPTLGIEGKVGAELADLLVQCLAASPESRPSMLTIRRAMADEAKLHTPARAGSAA